MGTVIPLVPISERTCGSCSLCCVLMGVPTVHKAGGEPCAFMTPGGGCDVYSHRPAECAIWECGWRAGKFGTEHDVRYRPDQVHALLTRASDGTHWTLIEDPAFPGVGRLRLDPVLRAYLAEDATHWIEIITGGVQIGIIGNLGAYYEWRHKETISKIVLGVSAGETITATGLLTPLYSMAMAAARSDVVG